MTTVALVWDTNYHQSLSSGNRQVLPCAPHRPHHAYPFQGVVGASSSLDAPRDWQQRRLSLVGRRCCRTPRRNRMELMLAAAAVCTITAGLAMRQAEKRHQAWDNHVDQALELVK